MMLPHYSQSKSYMDVPLMSILHGNLNQLSDESLKGLKNYFATGSLSLPARNSLLKDLTKHKAT